MDFVCLLELFGAANSPEEVGMKRRPLAFEECDLQRAPGILSEGLA
jgi:hypothetical protein